MSTLHDIADAFEKKADSDRDQTWLPRGTIRLLEVLPGVTTTADELLWLCALLLIVIERGGSCLPLEHIATLAELERLPEHLRRWSADQWRELLNCDAVGNGSGAVRPLVLAHDRLYFDRYYQLEKSIAQSLCAPLGPNARDTPSNWPAVVNAIFGDGRSFEGQHRFASRLFDSRVSILSGGPGTGKTHTIAKTLVALHTATKDSPEGLASVKLCAPTGKAAARIKESLIAAMDMLAQDDAVLNATDKAVLETTLKPTTIHKLLKITPTAARRRSSARLHVDVVICDETSMVDLALLAELLDAISPDTRIILVGDENQLQSVDVGTVMSELAPSIGTSLPGVTLTEVLRVDAESCELLPFFDAIRQGNESDVLTALEHSSQVLQHVDPSGLLESDLPRDVYHRATELVSLAERGATAAEFRPVLESTMVLAAQHNGPLSRNFWKDLVTTHLNIDLLPAPTVVGLPVLVTRTDHANGLTNGDTGLVVKSDEVTAVYRPAHDAVTEEDSVTVELPPAAIHEWQPWWAMTIHKSQGSEFGHVIVSITPGTRLLTRELLYTAVTRAKQRVSIVCTPDDLITAVKNNAKRFSGLALMIAEAHDNISA